MGIDQAAGMGFVMLSLTFIVVDAFAATMIILLMARFPAASAGHHEHMHQF